MHWFEISKYVSWKIWIWHPLFSYCTRISIVSILKKIEVKLDLSTDIDILVTAEKEIRGGIRHAIIRIEKANDKYMKYFDRNTE